MTTPYIGMYLNTKHQQQARQQQQVQIPVPRDILQQRAACRPLPLAGQDGRFRNSHEPLLLPCGLFIRRDVLFIPLVVLDALGLLLVEHSRRLFVDLLAPELLVLGRPLVEGVQRRLAGNDAPEQLVAHLLDVGGVAVPLRTLDGLEDDDLVAHRLGGRDLVLEHLGHLRRVLDVRRVLALDIPAEVAESQPASFLRLDRRREDAALHLVMLAFVAEGDLLEHFRRRHRVQHLDGAVDVRRVRHDQVAPADAGIRQVGAEAVRPFHRRDGDVFARRIELLEAHVDGVARVEIIDPAVERADLAGGVDVVDLVVVVVGARRHARIHDAFLVQLVQQPKHILDLRIQRPELDGAVRLLDEVLDIETVRVEERGQGTVIVVAGNAVGVLLAVAVRISVRECPDHLDVFVQRRRHLQPELVEPVLAQNRRHVARLRHVAGNAEDLAALVPVVEQRVLAVVIQNLLAVFLQGRSHVLCDARIDPFRIFLRVARPQDAGTRVLGAHEQIDLGVQLGPVGQEDRLYIDRTPHAFRELFLQSLLRPGIRGFRTGHERHLDFIRLLGGFLRSAARIRSCGVGRSAVAGCGIAVSVPAGAGRRKHGHRQRYREKHCRPFHACFPHLDVMVFPCHQARLSKPLSGVPEE
ncbi:hypothetical protein BN871_HY_00030 [Paenibacillus sp. P22]|nr:hypothetical protein BN871_HY_00030 [Paenibacillus sp. P22]